MVEDCAFSHKIDYTTFFLEILNLEGHINHSSGSRGTGILLNGGLCLLVELQWPRVCHQRGHPVELNIKVPN